MDHEDAIRHTVIMSNIEQSSYLNVKMSHLNILKCTIKKSDIILARFTDGLKTVRFVKNNNKFYMVGDIDHKLSHGEISNFKDRVEITSKDVRDKIYCLFYDTMNGIGSKREIWINERIYDYITER